MSCKLCDERQKEINRILKAYTRDKKIYRITIAALFALNILTIAFGTKGIKMFLDIFIK